MPAAKVDKYKLAFFSIPKSASTSVKIVLYKLREGISWGGNPDRVHPHFPTRFPLGPKDFMGLDCYFRFTVLRDPIKRILSSYHNRIFYHKDLEKCLAKNYHNEKKFSRQHPGLSFFPSIENYIENLGSYQNLSHSIMHHTIPSFYFIGSDLHWFDEIYTIDELDRLARDLTLRVGQPIVFNKSQESGKKYRFEDLSLMSKKTLLEYTRAEYDLLRDYFKPPCL